MSLTKTEDSLAQFLTDYIDSWNHRSSSRRALLTILCNNSAVPESVFLDKIWAYDPCRYELVNVIRSRVLFEKLFAYLNREVATTGITAPRKALLTLIKWPYFDKDCVRRCTFRTVEFWRHYCLYSPTVTEDIIAKYQIPNLGNLCFNAEFLARCSEQFRTDLFERHFTSIMLATDWRDIFRSNSYIIEHLNVYFCPNCTVRDRILSIDEVLSSVSWEFLVRYRDYIAWDKYIHIFERSDLTWDIYRTSFVFRMMYVNYRVERIFSEPTTIEEALGKSNYFGVFVQHSKHITRELLDELWPFLESYSNYLTTLITRNHDVVQNFIEEHQKDVLRILGGNIIAERIVYSDAWYTRVRNHPLELLINPTLPTEKWLEILSTIEPNEELLKLSTKLSKRLLTLGLSSRQLQTLIERYYHLWDIDFLITQGVITYAMLRAQEKYSGTRIHALIFAPGLSPIEREDLAEKYLNLAVDNDLKKVFMCPYFRVSFLRKYFERDAIGLICQNNFTTQRQLELQMVLYDLHHSARNPLVQQVASILNEELWIFL